MAGYLTVHGRPGRRTVLLAGLSTLIAGASTASLAGPFPDTLRIRNVNVTTGALKEFAVRDLPIAKNRFAADLQAALESRLGARFSRRGEAELEVSVTRVKLRTPEQSVVSPAPSTIEAVVSVRRARDGRALMQPARLKGSSGKLRMIGLIGLVTAPKPEKDYRDTLTGFSAELNETLFGRTDQR